MTAPIGSHVGEVLEPVWNTMIELFLIRIAFRIGLADTFGDYLRVALFVARIFAILALHAGGVFKELTTKSTTHDVVELLEHKFMTVKFMYFFFALADGAFTVQTNVEWSPVFQLFC